MWVFSRKVFFSKWLCLAFQSSDLTAPVHIKISVTIFVWEHWEYESCSDAIQWGLENGQLLPEWMNTRSKSVFGRDPALIPRASNDRFVNNLELNRVLTQRNFEVVLMSWVLSSGILRNQISSDKAFFVTPNIWTPKTNYHITSLAFFNRSHFLVQHAKVVRLYNGPTIDIVGSFKYCFPS